MDFNEYRVRENINEDYKSKSFASSTSGRLKYILIPFSVIILFVMLINIFMKINHFDEIIYYSKMFGVDPVHSRIYSVFTFITPHCLSKNN